MPWSRPARAPQAEPRVLRRRDARIPHALIVEDPELNTSQNQAAVVPVRRQVRSTLENIIMISETFVSGEPCRISPLHKRFILIYTVNSLLTTARSQGAILLGFVVVSYVAGIFYRYALWTWVLTAATPIHNVFLISIKCSLEFPLRLPFGILSSCETRLRHFNPEQLDVMERLDSLEKYLQTHMSAVNVANISARQLGRRDFGLYSGGAKIVHPLTSTHNYPPKRSLRFWEWANGPRVSDIHVHPPTTVLEDDIRIGRCWSFAGHVGSIGISLADNIQISDLTLQYVDSTLVSPSHTQQAPQSMILWGLLDGRTLPNAMSLALNTRNRTLCTSSCFSQSVPIPSTQPDTFYPLAEFYYDINSQESLQSFPISDAVRESDIRFQVVVLQVLSNWGSNSTCLYHIGIHGEPASVGL